ncbi:MAG: tetratricopeptide repeat protein [Bacteroidetes bacterium]|nr:tetratricopeptide repeat protein [Bacteroidota bacterium]
MMNLSKLTIRIHSLLIAILAPVLMFAQDFQSAIQLTKSEQFTLAGKAFQELLKQAPNNGDVYYYYGENYLSKYFSDTLSISYKEMADSASRLFETGTQVDPTNPLNYIGLGEINLIKGDRGKAQPFFDKAATLFPSKANKGVTLPADKHANALIRMANAYVRADIADTAVVFGLLRNAEKINSKNPEIYIVRGDAYIYLLNEGSKAITNYNMAQSLNPTSRVAKLRIGQLWLRAKQYQLALNNYEEVVKIDSTFAPAYRELGFLLSKANRNQDAKKNFKKFLQLSKGNTTARIQYINTLLDLQDYQEAINEINIVLASDSSNNDLNRALAYSYYEIGQYDKGLKYIRKFFSVSPAEKIRPSDMVYYGRSLAKNKLDSLAAEKLISAYRMDTSKPELLSEAATSYTKIKSYRKSLDVYQMKVDLNKATPMDFYNIGKIYYNIGEYQKSDSVLTIFNEMQPTYVQGFVYRARANVQLDPDSRLGLAKPVYEMILEKSRADTVKYAKDRMEAFSYLAYYYFLQYNQTKDKATALQSIALCERIIAIDPNDEKSEKARQIIDALKKVVK